jgi:hypothetical protein
MGSKRLIRDKSASTAEAKVLGRLPRLAGRVSSWKPKCRPTPDLRGGPGIGPPLSVSYSATMNLVLQ